MILLVKGRYPADRGLTTEFNELWNSNLLWKGHVPTLNLNFTNNLELFAESKIY